MHKEPYIDDSPSFRGFIAIKITRAVEEEIGRYQEKLKKEGLLVSYVKPSNIHLTLHFLGDIRSSVAKELSSRLADSISSFPGFGIEVASVGVFPSIQRASVFWAGLKSGAAEATALYERIEECVNKLGFAREERPFHPHLTLARIKRKIDPGILKNIILRDGERQFGEFDAAEIILFKSDLKPQGAEYSIVSTIGLKAADHSR